MTGVQTCALPICVAVSNQGKVWSDDTYDDNVKFINISLNALQEQVSNGSDLAFPIHGLATVMEGKDVRDGAGNVVKDAEGKPVKEYTPKDILISKAPRTFEYLATELYKRFGYVHPGAESFLGFRQVYQEGQPITDEQVEEFMKKCFT